MWTEIEVYNDKCVHLHTLHTILGFVPVSLGGCFPGTRVQLLLQLIALISPPPPPRPSPTSSSEWMWVARMTCQLRWCNWSFLLPVAASTHHLSSHHFAPDPSSWSKFSEGLSPPCLVSWAIATLTLMCPLLNTTFLWIGMFSQKIV